MAKALADLTYDDYAAYVQFKSKRSPNETTLQRYWTLVKAFREWVDRNPPNDEDPIEYQVARYHRHLTKSYRSNSRIVIGTAINWALRYCKLRGSDGDWLRLPLPPKQVSHRKPVVHPQDWETIGETIRARTSDREFLCISILRETGLRPSDIVRIRLEDVQLGDAPRIILTAKKNQAAVISHISGRTASMIQDYLPRYRPATYLFEPEPNKPYYRRWPWWILREKCGLDVTPSTFRRSVATLWNGNMKSLQLQGGWKDPKTIHTHYIQEEEDAHRHAFESLFGDREVENRRERKVGLPTRNRSDSGHSPSEHRDFCTTCRPRLRLEQKCQVTAVSPLSAYTPDFWSTSPAGFGAVDAAPSSFFGGP